MSPAMIAMGVDESAALAIAVTQRLWTYYLPPIWGYASLQWLTRKGCATGRDNAPKNPGNRGREPTGLGMGTYARQTGGGVGSSFVSLAKASDNFGRRTFRICLNRCTRRVLRPAGAGPQARRHR